MKSENQANSTDAGRRRQRRRSVADERKWLVEHDELGKTIEELAREANRSLSTVSRAIEKARTAKEIREVRSAQLRDAHVHHTRDLLLTAEEIRDAKSGNFAPSGGLRATLLEDALRTHISNPRIWRACGERSLQSRRLMGLRNAMNPFIERAVEEASKRSGPILKEGFAPAVR